MRHLFNRAILVVFVVASLAQGTVHARNRIDPTEAAALRANCDPALGSMRAGRVPQHEEISESERSALRTAEANSPELAQLRGGVVGTVLAVILIVILIVLLI